MSVGGVLLLILAGVFFITAMGLDFTLRKRMRQAGYRNVFGLGGALNYNYYHDLRKERGWPAWPVRLMWALYTCAIASLITGFFLYFGTHPTAAH